MESSPEPLCTRQLARHIITSEGWDEDDRRLRLAITAKVEHVIARMAKRGLIDKAGMANGATLWRLPSGRAAR